MSHDQRCRERTILTTHNPLYFAGPGAPAFCGSFLIKYAASHSTGFSGRTFTSSDIPVFFVRFIVIRGDELLEQ